MVSDFDAYVEANSWTHDFGLAGATRPQVFYCEDGVDRVIKLTGLGMSDGRLLAADWWGAVLASDLGLPTPVPRLVRVSEQALQTAPEDIRASAKPGFAFGAEYLPRAGPIIGLDSIMNCSNHSEALARMAVLDVWIDTPDRMTPEFGRNLLQNIDGRDHELVVIDFGLAFGAALHHLFGAGEDAMAEMSDPLRPEVRPLVSGEEIELTLEAVERMTEADIVKFVNSAPPEWVDDEVRGRAVRFLLDRQARVRDRVTSWMAA
jgi:HipA-like protein